MDFDFGESITKFCFTRYDDKVSIHPNSPTRLEWSAFDPDKIGSSSSASRAALGLVQQCSGLFCG